MEPVATWRLVNVRDGDSVVVGWHARRGPGELDPG